MFFKNSTKQRVLVFYLLTIFSSWFIWSSILWYANIQMGKLFTDIKPITIFLMLLGGICPSTIAFLLSHSFKISDNNNKGQQQQQFNLQFKINLNLLLFLIIPFLINFTCYFILGLLSKDHLSDITINKLIPGLIIAIFAGLGEEVGWRGFALNSLLTIYSPLKSAFIVEFAWSIWHTFGNYIALGDMDLFYLIPTILCNAFVNLISYSIIMTSLFIKSKGNMFLIILFHICISFSSFELNRKDITLNQKLNTAMVGALVHSIYAFIYYKIFGI
ncbi:hypothetical protein ABK040_014074 [Willaertia magna]